VHNQEHIVSLAMSTERGYTNYSIRPGALLNTSVDNVSLQHPHWASVNGKTDSTADSDPVILENRRNRVRDRKHRFPLFSTLYSSY
jgi:hypothetical protein